MTTVRGVPLSTEADILDYNNEAVSGVQGRDECLLRMRFGKVIADE